MMDIKICPICGHNAFADFIQCKDFTVSGQTFSLIRCTACGFVLTSPRPDIEQLERYYQSNQYISHTGKATTLTDRVYLIARKYTLRWKLNIVNRYATGRAMLDFGCGTGEFLNSCQPQWEISGVEPSPLAREKAKGLTRSPNIYESIDHVGNNQNAITLWHVLEHVPDLHQTLHELTQRLAENGTMFIAVPNRQSYDAEKYKAFWAGYDVPRHLWHFTKSDMTTLLKQHDLKLETILPMNLDAYYICLMSESYLSGNQPITSIPKAILHGMKSNRKAKKSGEYSSLIYIAKKKSL